MSRRFGGTRCRSYNQGVRAGRSPASSLAVSGFSCVRYRRLRIGAARRRCRKSGGGAWMPHAVPPLFRQERRGKDAPTNGRRRAAPRRAPPTTKGQAERSDARRRRRPGAKPPCPASDHEEEASRLEGQQAGAQSEVRATPACSAAPEGGNWRCSEEGRYSAPLLRQLAASEASTFCSELRRQKGCPY